MLYGLRQVGAEASRDVRVRLEPPRAEVLSTFHYVNQGGAEFVVFRGTPDDVEFGVQGSGTSGIPAFPGSAVGIKDASVHVAFFAMLFDQNAGVPIRVRARGDGIEPLDVPIDHRVFPQRFLDSRIELDDQFLQRVVPAIASATPDLHLSTAPQDLLPSFLKINGDLRRRNAQTLLELAGKTVKQMLWKDAFQQLLER